MLMSVNSFNRNYSELLNNLLSQITGAGHGIGKELAIKYASLGATVVCWDINEESNNETMNDIKRMGRDSVYAYR